MLPSKKVNAVENTCFVLGGIQAENAISDDELHTAMGKTPGKELKSTKDLRGTFVDIIDSICDDVEMAYPYKALLYKILKASPSETVELLGRYHYPDVKKEEQKRFIEELDDMTEQYFNTSTNTMEHIMILSKLTGVFCLIIALKTQHPIQ